MFDCKAALNRVKLKDKHAEKEKDNSNRKYEKTFCYGRV